MNLFFIPSFAKGGGGRIFTNTSPPFLEKKEFLKTMGSKKIISSAYPQALNVKTPERPCRW